MLAFSSSLTRFSRVRPVKMTEHLALKLAESEASRRPRKYSKASLVTSRTT